MNSAIKFRGSDQECEWECVENDSSTNSLEFEYAFIELTVAQHTALNITEKENDDITGQIAEIYWNECRHDIQDGSCR